MRLLIEVLQRKPSGMGRIDQVVVDTLDFTAQGMAEQAKALATMKARYVSLSISYALPTTFRFHQCFNDEMPAKPCILKEL